MVCYFWQTMYFPFIWLIFVCSLWCQNITPCRLVKVYRNFDNFDYKVENSNILDSPHPFFCNKSLLLTYIGTSTFRVTTTGSFFFLIFIFGRHILKKKSIETLMCSESRQSLIIAQSLVYILWLKVFYKILLIWKVGYICQKTH